MVDPDLDLDAASVVDFLAAVVAFLPFAVAAAGAGTGTGLVAGTSSFAALTLAEGFDCRLGNNVVLGLTAVAGYMIRYGQ
jgi:hypothetical protein